MNKLKKYLTNLLCQKGVYDTEKVDVALEKLLHIEQKLGEYQRELIEIRESLIEDIDL